MLESEDDDFAEIVGITSSKIDKVEDGYESEDSVLCLGKSIAEFSKIDTSSVGDDKRSTRNT